MKPIALTVVAVALIAAACGSSAEPAATVNGEELAEADVTSLLHDVGDGVSDAEMGQYLGIMVQWSAIQQAATETFAITASDEDVAEQFAGLLADAGLTEVSEEFLASQNVSEDGLRRFARQLATEAALREHFAGEVPLPTAEEAELAVASQLADWTVVCASHILVATADEATAVLDRLAAGEDFGALATELSIDTGSGAAGGVLGCQIAATYVPEFAAATLEAALGAVSPPVESQFGFHVIRVDERTVPSIEEAQTILQGGAIDEAVTSWIIEALNGAVVTVDARFGTWTTDPIPQIVPIG